MWPERNRLQLNNMLKLTYHPHRELSRVKKFITGLAASGLLAFSFVLSADEPGMASSVGKQMVGSALSGNVNEILQNGANLVGDKSASVAENALRNLFPTAQVELEWSDEYGLEGEALILSPLLESVDNSKLIFTQASVVAAERRTTVNIGLGARHLAMDDKLLMGVNAFYDHEFPLDHQRVSVGAEFRTTMGEINTNFYWGTSGWKKARKTNFSERAMDGFDIEYGMPLPYMPRTKFYGGYFRWRAQNQDGKKKADNGWSMSLDSEIFNGVFLELGHRYYNNSSDEVFASVQVDVVGLLTKKPANTKPFFSNVAWQGLTSMKENRYAEVRRQNQIVKETKSDVSDFSVTVSGF